MHAIILATSALLPTVNSKKQKFPDLHREVKIIIQIMELIYNSNSFHLLVFVFGLAVIDIQNTLHFSYLGIILGTTQNSDPHFSLLHGF